MNVVLDYGHPTSNGDLILLDGVTVPGQIPVTLNFNSNAVVGKCHPIKDKTGNLIGQIVIDKAAHLVDRLTPSICIKADRDHIMIDGNTKTVLKSMLVSVSLGLKNIDPLIRPLKEYNKR